MTIYKRPDNTIFAESAQSGEVVAFENMPRGWGVTLDNTKGIPPMEWFNFLQNRTDKAINYILQNGIAEYDTSLEYPQNAVVKSDGKLYLCLRQNTNKPLSNETYWELLIKNAATSQSGVVQLSNEVDSADETKASTSLAVKTLNDLKADKATTVQGYNIENAFRSEISAYADPANVSITGVISYSEGGVGLPSSLPAHVLNIGLDTSWNTQLSISKLTNDFWIRSRRAPSERFEIWSRVDVPVGAVLPFSFDKPEPGYLKCDGGFYNKNTYADLFEKIGYTYGKLGDKFAVPDFENRFVRNVGNGLRVGDTQEDAIRNISGVANFANGQYQRSIASTNGAISSKQFQGSLGEYSQKGVSTKSLSQFIFDASSVVPTAEENRPRAIAQVYMIKY